MILKQLVVVFFHHPLWTFTHFFPQHVQPNTRPLAVRFSTPFVHEETWEIRAEAQEGTVPRVGLHAVMISDEWISLLNTSLRRVRWKYCSTNIVNIIYTYNWKLFELFLWLEISSRVYIYIYISCYFILHTSLHMCIFSNFPILISNTLIRIGRSFLTIQTITSRSYPFNIWVTIKLPNPCETSSMGSNSNTSQTVLFGTFMSFL